MKGFIPELDALSSLFLALLSAAVLFSAASRSEAAAAAEFRETILQSGAESLASMIADGLLSPEGEVDIRRLESLAFDDAQVSVGGRLFGESPPFGKSVFVSRRVVRMSGDLAVLEVRKW